jgi:hypothetical protein
MSESLPRAARDLGAPAVLVHADIGEGNQEQSNKNAALIGLLLPPEEVPDRRYFIYRRI